MTPRDIYRNMMDRLRTFLSYRKSKSMLLDNISVVVSAFYLDQYSNPEKNHFVWAYNIRIRNQSGQRIKLLNRCWQIADSQGFFKKVSGKGVIGEQPLIENGQDYEYVSGTALSSPSGMMIGKYEMQDEKGKTFYVDVPPFSLDRPGDVPNLH